jgi:hypothetical protein
MISSICLPRVSTLTPCGEMKVAADRRQRDVDDGQINDGHEK